MLLQKRQTILVMYLWHQIIAFPFMALDINKTFSNSPERRRLMLFQP